MEWKTLVYGIIAVVIIVVVTSGFYVLTNPQVSYIKTINIPAISSLIEDCIQEEQQQQQKILQQTQQAQLQNVQNLVNAITYQFETCGKNDPRQKCRCTYAFGAVGENPLVITQLKDKIKITTSGGQTKEANYSTLYYDDLNHNLLNNRKLNEGDQMIIERGKADKWYKDAVTFTIKLKLKGQSVQEATTIQKYEENPDQIDSFKVFLNNIGLFKDGDKVGLYIPKKSSEISWGGITIKEKDPLQECGVSSEQQTKETEKPQEPSKISCESCGNGITNICNKQECQELANKKGSACYYIDYLGYASPGGTCKDDQFKALGKYDATKLEPIVIEQGVKEVQHIQLKGYKVFFIDQDGSKKIMITGDFNPEKNKITVTIQSKKGEFYYDSTKNPGLFKPDKFELFVKEDVAPLYIGNKEDILNMAIKSLPKI